VVCFWETENIGTLDHRLSGGVLARRPICCGVEDADVDYEFFKTKVEPIFLKKREGHTRCYVCHEESNKAFRLEKLPAGAAFWTEEQSRKNFDTVSALVVPGDHANSRLLLQPLALSRVATLTGKLWRSGSPVESHIRSECLRRFPMLG